MRAKAILTGLSLALLCCGQLALAQKLEVKPGTIWVMAGDSITAQRQHSNYIEAYYRTRFPGQKLQFRNSGIGGNTTGSVLARFDYDVADFKPTIVSVELGMNDVGAGPDPKRYIDGMTKLIERIRAVNATPVLISSSPVNDGSKLDDWKGDRCKNIHPYTDALVKLGQEQKVIVVDQYHPLLGMWGDNKRNEKGINLTGDAVHPGPTGQLTMAATILAALGAEREVSSATLKADGAVVEAKQCKITNAKSDNGVLSFTRLDERGPWPIVVAARPALDLMPEIADLSRYTLTVTGLADGDYDVKTNGVKAATVSAKDLAKGWNMSFVPAGVIADRAAKITGQIGLLQSTLNNNWRAASKAKDAGKLAEAQSAIDKAESELADACQPVAIEFQISPASK